MRLPTTKVYETLVSVVSLTMNASLAVGHRLYEAVLAHPRTRLRS